MNIEEVVIKAFRHKTMIGLAKEMNINITMLKYNLGKVRRLEEVKAILRSNQKRMQ
jgi:hypothetical protein